MTKEQEELKAVALATLQGIKANGDWDRFEFLQDKSYDIQQQYPHFKIDSVTTLITDEHYLDYLKVQVELGDIRERALKS